MQHKWNFNFNYHIIIYLRPILAKDLVLMLKPSLQYNYNIANPMFRKWRKNKNPKNADSCNHSKSYYGVDLNR